MKQRNREKDMELVVGMVLGNLLDIIGEVKRPFGSSDVDSDILRCIELKGPEGGDWTEENSYAWALLENVPEWIRQKIEDAKP